MSHVANLGVIAETECLLLYYSDNQTISLLKLVSDGFWKGFGWSFQHTLQCIHNGRQWAQGWKPQYDPLQEFSYEVAGW